MFNRSNRLAPVIIILISSLGFLTSCNFVKTNTPTATLLKTEDASREELMNEVNRFASVNSVHAKMYLKFEDNSFAEFGNKEVYRAADGDVVVQRPSKIYMRVQVPVLKTDVAQMTSDGTSFRVAILQDGGSGRYKKFVKGTNDADYSKLQKVMKSADLDNGKAIKENVNAFASLRPQHFTDAILVRPIDAGDVYAQSTIFQIEEDTSQQKKSPIRKVTRGYYLLDEFAKDSAGNLEITRRFWFDRVGGIRLARQQIFDIRGEVSSDIVYGKPGNLSDDLKYANLPLEITVTRPKEKYSMKLTYQTPESVTVGKLYPDTAFQLENSWPLPEVDLDKELREVTAGQPQNDNRNSASRAQ
ncbi:MAG: hypothetical protein ABI999_01345 [Acidobacteriota bacterium]